MAAFDAGRCSAARRRFLRLAVTAALAGGAPILAAAGQVELYADDTLGRYGFGDGHPLGTGRQGAFLRAARAAGLLGQVQVRAGRAATRAELARFHTAEFIDEIATAETGGRTLLDAGDTPVFPDVFRVSAHVVGSALAALERVMTGACRRTFQPVGGLHHAGRGQAAGFCVFNDLGVVIETLRGTYGLERIAYVDIDAHHGDGVFYAFEASPQVVIADIHQDSRTLYPGTGRADETGTGAAAGTKLNIELPPRAGDPEFLRAWQDVERHLRGFEPELFVFQCGADSLAGDPIAQLRYSPAAHAHAAKRLCALADEYAGGRLMAFGGGGYDRDNLARAWSAVLRELLA
ncbi:MAG: acetoin utilization protein AcuC [Gammaproteobacteria bacterium]|nr:acetoin utilization protein AcuC [Gammaproteobacteria bacterium]